MIPDRTTAAARVDAILAALAGLQEDDGEFAAQRYFHGPSHGGVTPTAWPGWFRFGKCPFFTATIVYHLRDLPQPAASTLRERACDFLAGCFEGDLVRYVPARYQEVWFPLDVDDTCLVRKMLRDAGRPLPGDDARLLANRNRRGQFYTWFVPRPGMFRMPGHLARLCRDTALWLRRLHRQDSRNAWRLVREYWSTQEPAVDANLLLYFGNDARITGLAARTVQALRRRQVDLEYYDSLLVPYFHAARAHRDGVEGLGELAGEFRTYLAGRAATGGPDGNAINAAMTALTLIYFDSWDAPELAEAMAMVHANPMHTTGWAPAAYANPVNRAFSDGSAALTAVLHADAIQQHAARLTAMAPPTG